MELSELRKELLRQHADLRRLADTVVGAGVRARRDPSLVDELRALLVDLDAALLAHNAYEDRELHAILPTIDAWGDIRDALVDERHTAEHDAIGVGIRAAASHFSAGEIADRTEEVIAQLLGHMDREEREFLHAEVLRDDIVTSGVGG